MKNVPLKHGENQSMSSCKPPFYERADEENLCAPIGYFDHVTIKGVDWIFLNTLCVL